MKQDEKQNDCKCKQKKSKKSRVFKFVTLALGLGAAFYYGRNFEKVNETGLKLIKAGKDKMFGTKDLIIEEEIETPAVSQVEVVVEKEYPRPRPQRVPGNEYRHRNNWENNNRQYKDNKTV